MVEAISPIIKTTEKFQFGRFFTEILYNKKAPVITITKEIICAIGMPEIFNALSILKCSTKILTLA